MESCQPVTRVYARNVAQLPRPFGGSVRRAFFCPKMRNIILFRAKKSSSSILPLFILALHPHPCGYCKPLFLSSFNATVFQAISNRGRIWSCSCRCFLRDRGRMSCVSTLEWNHNELIMLWFWLELSQKMLRMKSCRYKLSHKSTLRGFSCIVMNCALSEMAWFFERRKASLPSIWWDA